MDALPEQGRLDELPLPRLLLELHRAGFSGALTLSRERVGKRFLFHQGVPVFAESNLASESLGVQLMDTGKIDRQDYNRIVARIEASGCKEGTALLELGLLTPKELFLALKEQVRRRLLECFGWPTGEFYVDRSAEPPGDAQPFRSDLHSLLQEGIEAHWSGERVLHQLAERMERFPHPAKHFDRVAARLHSDEAVQSLLEALDGTRTLWKAVQAANTPRALAAAWVLDAAGALDYGDAPHDGEGGDAPPPPEVEIVFDEAAPAAAPVRPPRPARAKRPAARASDGATEALHREIVEKYAHLGELDHYALLGVERNAGPDAIKRAYLQAAKSYHPDALTRRAFDAELNEQANRVFAEIGKAHAVLSDPARRRDYDAILDTDSSDLDANRLAQAETLYRKAEILLRQGNFRGALEFLKPAVEAWPEECAYQSALGWALYKKAPSEPEAAREHLERASRIDPDDGVTLFRLSVVLRDLGDDAAAQAAADRAQNLDSRSR